MKKRSNKDDQNPAQDFTKLIGLGSLSARKNYYPELQRKMLDLLKLQNLLKSIIDSMPSVLIAVNREGMVTQWNNEAEKNTGITASKAVGKPISEVYSQIVTLTDTLKTAIEEQEIQQHSKVRIKSGGADVFYDVTVYPLGNNEIEGAVVRVDDITRRVQIEEMMIQSDKMLSVGGLAAGLAHEINNPLTSIISSMQIISNRLSLTGKKNDTAAAECGTTVQSIKEYSEKRGIFRMLESVKEAGIRAGKIVSNVLSFSRAASAQFSDRDIVELLDDTIELAGSDINMKKKYRFNHIKISRDYEADLPHVECEGSKIQQVFFNIIINGVQAIYEKYKENQTAATEMGKKFKPLINARVKRSGKTIRVELEDNGTGMDESTKRRIFEPFYTTKGIGDGTGLGMSIAYFIITENHKGTMRVESEKGKGTKFIINLPIEQEPESPAQQPE